MTQNKLKYEEGHLFATIDDKEWLIDTGAPQSFGRVASIIINEQKFDVSRNYAGLTSKKLSQYIEHDCTGLLGVDILNNFDIVFDVMNKTITWDRNDIDVDGICMPISDFMGIPIVDVHINEKKFSMFFDTGAKISYIQDDIIETYPKSGIIDDFYPGFGTFQTQRYRVELDILDTQHTLQCGMLPDILGMTLKIGGTDGILGNQLFLDHVVSYHPGKKQICLMK